MRTDAPRSAPVARVPLALTAQEVLGYLAGRGVAPGAGVSVEELADGVSARVYLVQGDRGRFVVKQALPELRVATHWAADPARSATEAAALALASQLTPGHCPQLVDVDSERCAITMTAAPAALVNLRRRLLQDELDPALTLGWFTTLGSVLGTWHERTWHDGGLASRFDDDAAFEDLRIAPFYRAVARVHPDLREVLDRCVAELETTRECLVHGDFSPKNVLTGAGEVWVLDFEVARFGAAVFDVAFMGHHLLLKALARPTSAALHRRAFEEFQRAYALARSPGSAHDREFASLGHHLGALVLARVDGVSRTSYLTPAQQDSARDLAVSALASAETTDGSVWDHAMALAGEDAHGR